MHYVELVSQSCLLISASTLHWCIRCACVFPLAIIKTTGSYQFSLIHIVVLEDQYFRCLYVYTVKLEPRKLSKPSPQTFHLLQSIKKII